MSVVIIFTLSNVIVRIVGVGDHVGSFVGRAVGAVVGIKVGGPVYFIVGDDVGVGIGDDVGFNVPFAPFGNDGRSPHP